MNKIKLLLVSMTLLSLTACQTKPKVEEGKIGGTLTVVTSRPDAAELFEEIEEGFKKKYPEVEDIIWESSSDYDADIMKRMNTKDYGDVLFVPFSMAGTPSEYENYFYPLGKVEDLEKKYLDVTEAVYNDTVYGLPVSINILGFVYNEDVLKKAGVESMPTSTDALLETCDQIESKTGATCFYTNYNTSLGVWAGALSSYGENYKEAALNGNPFDEGQPIREVMDLFYKLAAGGYIEEDPITGDYNQSLQLLADGKVAMIMRASQDLATIQALNDSEDNIKLAPFPTTLNGTTSVPVGAPGVIGINKNTENLATAKAFLEYFISAESGYAEDLDGVPVIIEELNDDQRALFEEGTIVKTASTEDAAIQERYSAVAGEVGIARLTDVLQKVINIGLYPEQNQSYEDYVKELQNAWDQALKNHE
ncbi:MULTISPECIES: ABC transporter substrate-binding protein [Turicibacter]|uniref:Sugar ABC transporter substrate-binding protein n=1 Tax=Turicibacter faecis TaxID=2963365 RepID=A0ABN6ZKN9_9FIRM|nr:MULTISPECIES: ABC transporter substrate-binding protein [unclassified Turicibacter]MCU7204103.1 ABC transporter substrate-binding protein [Turicibacter sp. TA25]MCU7208462.1 ABC transporter substrate-binding protein [Turicibacter sp. 1E2]NCE78765.1 carbohydrate ABC transporter substrate-binding protein [Turicibacter sp. TS3]BEH91901.1 sugar ABC transporter substrate-binding protein [Turicibacter sp. TC023]